MHEKTRVFSPQWAAASHAIVSKKVLTGVVGALAFALLTLVGSNIYIPLTPVPITLQTLFVLLAGAVVGARVGALSQILFVGAGVAGLPFFAGQASGWGVFAGPTGGYLASFLLVPMIVGVLYRRRPGVRWQLFVFSAGTAVVFVLGVAHLAVFYASSVGEAIRLGFLPFIPGAIFKIAAATSIARTYFALVRR